MKVDQNINSNLKMVASMDSIKQEHELDTTNSYSFEFTTNELIQDEKNILVYLNKSSNAPSFKSARVNPQGPREEPIVVGPGNYYVEAIQITLSPEKKKVVNTNLQPSSITESLVKFHAEEGFPPIQRQYVPFGGKAIQSKVQVPVRNGYEFDGWYYYEKDSYKLRPNGREVMLPFSFDQAIYGDIDFYAKWNKVEEVVEEKKPVPHTADGE